MKKIRPHIIAAIMAFSLLFTSTTTFAAGSPVGGGIDLSPVGGDVVVHNPQSPTDGAWMITDVYGTGIPQGLICVQEPLSIEDQINLLAAVQSAARSRGITVKNQFMINLSLRLNGQAYDQQGKPITFTMIYSGIRPWDKALIVHLKHDGSFELIDAVCGYDEISFTLTSLSPLALLITQGTESVDSTAKNTTALSPKTDESSGFPYWWIIVAAALILSVIGVRKLARKN